MIASKATTIILIIFILKILCCPFSFAKENSTIYISTAINSPVARIKQELENSIPSDTKIIYTFVPRGLIISIDESHFFSGESIEIKCSAREILDNIADILGNIETDCTIECHTEGHSTNLGAYKTNWEISMARANEIADYFIFCKKIPTERIFPLGFGDLMPFKENVSNKGLGFDKRIDFVIFDYEYER